MKFALPLAVLVLAHASPCFAQNARVHDGFYLRLGGGVGFISDAFETEEDSAVEISGTIQGTTFPGEIAIGGTVAPGLVLGGGLYWHYAPSPSAEEVEVQAQGLESELEIEFEPSQFTLIGPMVDYYFDPRRGLHLQGSVGLALFALGEGEVAGLAGFESEEQSGGGLGAMVGVGHEWWIADNWGLGILGRVAVGVTGAEDDNEVEWTHTVLAPSLLFTATMN